MTDHAAERLAESIYKLAHAVHEASDRHNTQVILHRIAEMENKIMATQAEIASQLRGLVDTVNKIGVETDKSLQLIKDLQEAVNNQTDASPELIDATNALAAQLKAVDDKVPDTIPTPPV